MVFTNRRANTMGKCRPLSADEADALKAHTHDLRDHCLLIALEKTGYRASEIASLKTEDVFDFTSKTIKPRVQVKAAHIKKKVGRMAIPIHPDWRQTLTLWLAKLQQFGYLRPGVPLWLSRKHVAKIFGLARETIWRLVRQASIRAGVDPDRWDAIPIASSSMFASIRRPSKTSSKPNASWVTKKSAARRPIYRASPTMPIWNRLSCGQPRRGDG
jgi:integrase